MDGEKARREFHYLCNRRRSSHGINGQDSKSKELTRGDEKSHEVCIKLARKKTISKGQHDKNKSSKT